MKRVVKLDGKVMIIEHEVPSKKLVKILFNIRMLMMGPTDSREFVKKGLIPFQEIFNDVTLSHTRSGKSKMFVCKK